jgi:hypothetical protein
VALIAMAAGAPGPRGFAGARPGHVEVALARGEAEEAVRAVAAVVAAARDLLAGSRPTVVMATPLATAETSDRVVPARMPAAVRRAERERLLGERLLDLPPPRA